MLMEWWDDYLQSNYGPLWVFLCMFSRLVIYSYFNNGAFTMVMIVVDSGSETAKTDMTCLQNSTYAVMWTYNVGGLLTYSGRMG